MEFKVFLDKLCKLVLETPEGMLLTYRNALIKSISSSGSYTI
jgi:hypothetical protein